MDSGNIKQILDLVDKDPYLLHSAVEYKPVVESLMDKGLITYGKCGCSLPSIHVTKEGRAFLKEHAD